MTAVPDQFAWPEDLPPPVGLEPLSGGWVCRTFRGALTDGREVVVKVSPYPADAEADGLRALAAAGIPTPTVYGWRDDVLVLEHLEGPPDWAGFGRTVARMHSTAGPAFGWHRDNRMGRFEQANGWTDSWSEFYAERRVLAHLIDPRIPSDLADRLRAACAGPLQALLPERPEPVLTHGDLWAGNVVNGRWLVDPEVCFADRELDVAFMQRSQSLPAEFWRAYEAVLPYRPGFAARRGALQIHHILLQMRHFDPAPFRTALEGVLASYGW